MGKKKAKITQPAQRLNFSNLAHTALNLVLPVILLLLVRLDLVELAFGLVVLSKWRIFAVMPRHWLANIRSNATDLVVNLALLAFIVEASTLSAQLAWTGFYVLWLTVIKPRSDYLSVAIQAATGQLLGMAALMQFDDLNEMVILLGIGFISISSARHFLSSYEEPYARPISYLWGLMIVQLSWVLYRWTLVYFIVPQAAIIVGVIGYTAASLYDQNKKEQLSPKIVRQHLILASVIIVAVIALADWSGEGI